MGFIYVVLGKSASGKDSVYKKLLDNEELPLKECVIYTTRPQRNGEVQGKEYHFVSDDIADKLQNEGKIIEMRTYQTVYGPWKYFTVDDGQFDTKEDCIMIGTLESYRGIRKYFGDDRVVPVYIEVDDYTRLCRALERERTQVHPGYVEMCRRFIADSEDFSEEKLDTIGITVRFENNNLDDCVSDVLQYMKKGR